MLSVLLALCTFAATVASDVTVADLECDTIVQSQTAVQSINTVVILDVTTRTLPVSIRLEDAELANSFQIRIIPSSIRISASDAMGRVISLPLTYDQLVLDQVVLEPLGSASVCVLVPGCDGMVLDTVKTVRLFPSNIKQIIFNLTAAYLGSLSTSSFGPWMLLAVAATTASATTVLGDTGPVILTLDPSQQILETSFTTTGSAAATSSASTDTTTIVYVVVGVLGGILLCAILGYVCWGMRTQAAQTQVVHELAHLIPQSIEASRSTSKATTTTVQIAGHFHRARYEFGDE